MQTKLNQFVDTKLSAVNKQNFIYFAYAFGGGIETAKGAAETNENDWKKANSGLIKFEGDPKVALAKLAEAVSKGNDEIAKNYQASIEASLKEHLANGNVDSFFGFLKEQGATSMQIENGHLKFYAEAKKIDNLTGKETIVLQPIRFQQLMKLEVSAESGVEIKYHEKRQELVESSINERAALLQSFMQNKDFAARTSQLNPYFLDREPQLANKTA